MWRAVLIGDSLIDHLVPYGSTADSVFRMQHFTIRTKGVRGGKVTNWVHQKDKLSLNFGWIAGFRPHVVIVAVGTNDLCSEGVSAHDINAATVQLIDYLQDLAPSISECDIFPVLPRYAVGSQRTRYVQMDLGIYNSKVEELNELNKSIAHVDSRVIYWEHIHAQLRIQGLYCLDGVHMRQSGKNRMISSIRHCLMRAEERLLHALLDDA